MHAVPHNNDGSRPDHLNYLTNLLITAAIVSSRSALGDASNGSLVEPRKRLKFGGMAFLLCHCPSSMESAAYGRQVDKFHPSCQASLDREDYFSLETTLY